MKRLALIACLVLSAGSLRAQTVVFGVGGEGASSDVIRVPIFADLRGAGGHKLGSYAVRLQWNPSFVSFNGVTAGSFGDIQVSDDSAYSYGVLRVAGLSVTGAAAVTDLFDLHLIPGSTTTAIDLEVLDASAAVTFADLTPFVATIDGEVCESPGRWGDIDGDGASTSRDALGILSKVVGLEPDESFDLSLGDVNGDTKTNSLDALIILSYAVGLQVPGQRILLPASGDCGTGAAPSLKILPDTIDVVVHQDITLALQAIASDGKLVTLEANWESQDPNIAFVNATGMASGRAPGTTRITAALGPGIRFSAPVVVRPGRSTWIVNAPKARGTTLQLGTVSWPFQSPQQAFPFLREGDTVRVAPGIHDYQFNDDDCDYYECCYECDAPRPPAEAVAPVAILGPMNSMMTVGAVLIGDTLPDGTRPILRSTGYSYHAAAEWMAGRHGVVKNLVFQNFYTGIAAAGVQNLTIDNVRIEANLFDEDGYAVLIDSPLDTLRITNSAFIADSSYDADRGVGSDAPVRFAYVRGSTFSGWQYCGLCFEEIDSLDVANSEFKNNGSQGGIGVYSYDFAAARVALSHNHFLDNYRAADMQGILRAHLDHNLVEQTVNGDDAFRISAGYSGGGAPPQHAAPRSASSTYAGSRVTLKGDSINITTGYYNWLTVQDFDSVLVDSVHVEGTEDDIVSTHGYIDAGFARIRNSTFLDLGSEAFTFTGDSLVVDNSDFAGCAVCDWNTSSGFGFHPAVSPFGGSLTLTNSSFYNLENAVTDEGTGQHGRVVIVGNTADSVQYGFHFHADSVVVTDNVLTRVGVSAVHSSGYGPGLKHTVMLRNKVTCKTGAVGIQVYDAPAIVEDNAVRGPCAIGIDANNYSGSPLATARIARDTVLNDSSVSGYVGISVAGRWSPQVLGNRVQGGGIGILIATNEIAAVTVDSNAVSGSGNAGIQLASLPDGSDVSGRWNRIENNLGNGILIDYYNFGIRSFTLGSIAGNALFGINVSSESTVDATENWWGDAGGAGSNGANDNTGSVDASSPKSAPPGDIPPLAPKQPAAVAVP